MATARKRSRADAEETQAECPFKIEHPNPNEKDKKSKKRRRNGSEDSPAPSPKIPLQPSPFAPTGKFKDPNNNMDRHFLVTPNPRWVDMTRYNSFVLNGVKYFSEGFIFVANSSTIDRPRNSTDAMLPRKKSEEDWVARILEIRASDEHHVYARVYWMYWPDELPDHTCDGKRYAGGRQPYHGINELVASNHMDIINVVSVTAPAVVNQWDEQNEDEVQQALYWRQAIDVRTMELSSVELRCKCQRPEHPDKMLLGCSNELCNRWLHDDCLAHDALMETWKRLGSDKPHIASAIKHEDVDSDGPKRPLSPSESGAAPTAQASIDVKPEEKSINLFADVDGAPNDMQLDEKESFSSIPVASASSEPKKRGRPRKSEAGVESEDHKPYLGLFEAVVRNDPPAPSIEITDLRYDVTGGERIWKEPVKCLICHQVIH